MLNEARVVAKRRGGVGRVFLLTTRFEQFRLKSSAGQTAVPVIRWPGDMILENQIATYSRRARRVLRDTEGFFVIRRSSYIHKHYISN